MTAKEIAAKLSSRELDTLYRGRGTSRDQKKLERMGCVVLDKRRQQIVTITDLGHAVVEAAKYATVRQRLAARPRVVMGRLVKF